jgi:hypothetical protein
LWPDFDRLPYDILIPVFAFRRIGWIPDCMPDEARSQYDGLPDEGIRVFRGKDRDGLVALSWTLDQTVADGFARGHRGIFNPNPVVPETVIAKRDIAFAVPDREEAELVLSALPLVAKDPSHAWLDPARRGGARHVRRRARGHPCLRRER